MKRFVIVFDGRHYHVRRLASSRHDGVNDEMVYTCDRPIASDLMTLNDAEEAAYAWLRSKKGPGDDA